MYSEENGIAPVVKRLMNSLMFKLIGIGLLLFVLLLPTSMLRGIIRERSNLQSEAVVEISDKWGHTQAVIGPVLTVPYMVRSRKKYAHFLPEKLMINGELIPKTRYRGIYKAVLYEAQLKLSGEYSIPDFAPEELKADEILYHEAFLQIGIPDMRGITNAVQVDWNGTVTTAEPGIPTGDVTASGMHVPIDLSPSRGKLNVPFHCSLHLNGSEHIAFTPVGKETTALLKSTWDSPGFDGSFLPQNHTITRDGFEAEWNVLHFNRNYPQSWLGADYSIGSTLFGVRMVTPVEHYLMVTRSVKYAVLFIFLTFVVFFMVEIARKYKVHPFQYLLIGTALVLFYALLLSLSEHLAFALAYAIAAGATVSLLIFYLWSVFNQVRQTVFFGVMFTVLYGFLYVILQSEDYALLIGSVGLFMLLGVIMFLTRKIDWYAIGKTESAAAPALES